MPAMTMSFGVSGSLAGVQPGDRIKAVLVCRALAAAAWKKWW